MPTNMMVSYFLPMIKEEGREREKKKRVRRKTMPLLDEFSVPNKKYFYFSQVQMI
jgi:hypothetical protein